jgi:flagellar biosynthesis protein FlhF
VNIHTFIAGSVVEAIEQIRQQLGPQAAVLNVRRLPAEGLARLWQKPRIEVLAFIPEAAPTPVPADAGALAELRQELAQIKEQVLQREPASRSTAAPGEPAGFTLSATEAVGAGQGTGGWRVASLLEKSGLFPVHVQQVLDQVRAQAGGQPPETLAQELSSARAALMRLWRANSRAACGFHVLIGPPGVGKTTVLCKWLAQAVLVEGRRARVWRLDDPVANTAESLGVFAEILGVPVERSQPEARDASELVLVDLPGVNWKDTMVLKELAGRLTGFEGAQVHLVLNAAYEGELLLAQGRAFSALPIDDVILTHLDEEPRWGKLWNLVLGTNYTIASLSAGQNIPGEFRAADPEQILFRHFPRN